MTARFQLEPHTLPHELPDRFERFYRAKLRLVIGRRLRSNAVKAAYDEWANAANAGSMTFSQLRAALELVGHKRRQSNGVHYDNLAFSSDYPDLADTLQTPIMVRARLDRAGKMPRSRQESSDMIAGVDRALAALLEVRSALVAQQDIDDPVGAARRALELGR